MLEMIHYVHCFKVVMSGLVSSGSAFTGMRSLGKQMMPPAGFCARNTVGCWRKWGRGKVGGACRPEGTGLVRLLDSVVECSSDGELANGLHGGEPLCNSTLLDEEHRSDTVFLFTTFVQSVGRSSIPISFSVCPILYRTVNFPLSLPILQSFLSCTSYGFIWWINFPFFVVDMVYFPAVTLSASFFVAWLNTVSAVFLYSCFT